MKRVLGLDYGAKYVGVAISASSNQLALISDTITYQDFNDLAQQLLKIVQAEDIGTIVVGLPLRSVENAQIKLIKKFVQDLELFFNSLGQEVELQTADESFTTKIAGNLFKDQAKNITYQEHSIAAQLILQGYLD